MAVRPLSSVSSSLSQTQQSATQASPNWQQYVSQLNPDAPLPGKDPAKMSDFYGKDTVNQFKQQYTQQLQALAQKQFPATVDGKKYQTFDDAAKAVVQSCNQEGQFHAQMGQCIMTMCITSFQQGQMMMQQFASPFGDGS